MTGTLCWTGAICRKAAMGAGHGDERQQASKEGSHGHSPDSVEGQGQAAIYHLMGVHVKDIRNMGKMVELMAYLIRKKA
jgi:hypothetical protein